MEPVMTIEDIMKILPHRYPFLLVDRVIEKNGTDTLVAIKNVTMNEEFFNGHFPGKPVMPGVLQVEAMAQAVGLLMLEPGKIPLFMSIDNCKFRKGVVPGDQLRIEVEKIKVKTFTMPLFIFLFLLIASYGYVLYAVTKEKRDIVYILSFFGMIIALFGIGE